MRAEVSADDVTLTRTHVEPELYARSVQMLTADGLLRPGQSAPLLLHLRNYGVDTGSADVRLTCSDPYVTITARPAWYGPLAAGQTACNENDALIVSAATFAPEGHRAEITVLAEHDSGVTISSFPIHVGRRHFLVWDATPDRSSGPVIYRTLRALGYSGAISAELSPEEIGRYQTLWGCAGIRGRNALIPAGGPEARAITAMLVAGGNVYLEGGEIWYNDPPLGGEDFGPAFGVSAYSNGYGDIYQIAGVSDTFVEGMLMSYQGENSSIDRITAIGPAFPICHNNGPFYYCVVAREAECCRTIGASIELGSLRDGVYPSTKAVLADRIMHFFLHRNLQQAPVPRSSDPPARLAIAPNPCRDGAVLSGRFAQGLRFELYDAGGRRLAALPAGRQAGDQIEVPIDTRDLAPGCYFIRPPGRSGAPRGKLLVVR